MRKLFILGMIALWLTAFAGCIASKPGRIPMSKRVEFPEIGRIHKADIGDTLLKKSILTYIEGIDVKSTGSYKGIMGDRTILPGFKFPAGYTDEWELYLFSPKNSTMNNRGIPNRIAVDRTSGVLGWTYGNIYASGMFVRFVKWDIEPPYIKAKTVDVDSPGYEQELIYNGKVNTSIRFIYREFSSKMIRAAFNQEVQYDLADGNIIGFKEARIEVIEASNTFIRYKVIKSFDWRY